ncbi:MAG: outer membrane lipoprotein carrier protein LolA [Acidobacteria bacterium]|nr:outer membrane lipoprotein carrier protein LolA [Acidobacteriota bacterium]
MAILILLPPLSNSVPAQESKSTWTLEAVLKQLDSEAKGFHGLTANIERTKVTVVVNDRSTESGTISVRRDDKMLIELTKPDARIILRRGDKLEVYHARTKRVEEYDLGKHRSLVDQFLLLGFGTSGGDLKKGYDVTPHGELSMDNKKVLFLELTPRNDKVRSNISKINLWIDEATWLPIQQKFFETGSQDYFEIKYTNVFRNPKIPDSKFKPSWPKDVERIKPNV